MPRVDTRFPLLRARHIRESLAALAAVYRAQHDEVQARFESGASVLLLTRWDAVLAEVVLERNLATAGEIALRVAKAFDAEFDVGVMTAWLAVNAEAVAGMVNQSTRDQLAESDEPDKIDKVFAELEESGAERHARGVVTAAAGFAAADVAQKVGAGAKLWRTRSGNSRSSHESVNGETVAIGGTFSNGLRWPGDSRGDLDEVANCRCSLTIL
jgi:hypothetical protein